MFHPATDDTGRVGIASKRWNVVFASSGVVQTSDARDKRRIGAIPASWLDAWGAVEWRRFRWKGRKRWHVGLIAQAVHAAFAAHGIDAFAIGLMCFDQWDEQRDGKGRVTAKAGDRWGLRYDQCLALEAAWQRREMARLDARLARLEGAAA